MTAGNATLTNSGALSMAASTLSGALNLSAAGISQTGALSVGGTTTLSAGGGAISLTNGNNDFNLMSVGSAAGATIAAAHGFTVTGIDATGSVRLTTLAGDLNATGNWSISNGDLTLSAGAASARGVAAGGDVNSAAAFAMDAGRILTVYTGSTGSTVLGGSLAQRATSGSGNFRYDRQDGDAPGAANVGDGTTYVMYRDRPSVTVTPTDANNIKVYNGAGADPPLAYGIDGQLHGDTAAQIFTGSLGRAPGQNVGSYAMTSGTLADQLGYQVVFAPGHTFGITPAPLLITVNDSNRYVGQQNPSFGVSYRGFVGGETMQSAGLQGQLAFFTTATSMSAPGSYAVSASGLTSGNYSIGYAAGTLSVRPASLATVMLNSASMDPSYSNAVANMEAKARAAGLLDAPTPAQAFEQGWRAPSATFQAGDTRSDEPPDRSSAMLR